MKGTGIFPSLPFHQSPSSKFKTALNLNMPALLHPRNINSPKAPFRTLLLAKKDTHVPVLHA